MGLEFFQHLVKLMKTLGGRFIISLYTVQYSKTSNVCNRKFKLYLVNIKL